jgi:ribosome-binding factor A
MPREFQRIDRIAALIQRELSKLLVQEIRDPRLSLITINKIEISKDLAHAKVFVTHLQSIAQAAERKRKLGSKLSDDETQVVKILNKAASHLRYHLAHNLTLRVTPALRFIYDTSLEQAMNLNHLIEEAVESDENKTKN